MTAFLEAFVNIVKSLLNLLFEWNVVGNVSIGHIFVALFIVRVAFSILIKGASVSWDGLNRDVRNYDRRHEIKAKKEAKGK